MNIISKLFIWVLYSSLTAGILSLIIILIALILNDRIGPRFHHALWLLVLIRLLVPVVPESPLSILNLLPEKFQNVIDSKKNTLQDTSVFLTEEHNYDNSNESDSFKNHSRNDNITDNKISFKGYSNNQNRKTLPSHVLRIASLTWFVGFLSIALFTLIAMFRFKKKAMHFRKLEDPELTSLLEDCLEKLKIKNSISVYADMNFKSPCILGIINARIYLPEDIYSKINSNQLMHIILHELSHYKRKDVVYNLLGTTAVMIHWFNPIVWFTAKKMKLLREIASDAYVLEILGEEEVLSYGMTIVDISKLFLNNHKQLSLVSFFETKNQIKRRIDMIKSFKKGSYKISIAAIICCIIIGSVTLTNAMSPSSIANSNDITTEKPFDMINNNDTAGEVKFLIDASIKSYNDINKMAKVAGFKFKVPDFVPSGYIPSAFHMIKASEKANIIKIFFDKKIDQKTSYFSFLASQEDLKRFLVENAKNEYGNNENIKCEIKSNEEPLSFGNLTGSALTITSRITANENHWETIKKFFLWQNEDIWYGIEYIRYSIISKPDSNRKPDINRRIDLSQEDIKEIAKSVNYLQNIKNIDYAPITPEISTEIGQLSIYDEEDLEKGKTLLGFPIKFPLIISEDVKASYADVGISSDSDIKNNKINYELVMIYTLPKGSMTFVQRENSQIYDYAIENGYFEFNGGEGNKSDQIKTQLLSIGDKDVLRYEISYEDKICEINYVWKENGFYCTAYFSPEAENQEDIVKYLIMEK